MNNGVFKQGVATRDFFHRTDELFVLAEKCQVAIGKELCASMDSTEAAYLSLAVLNEVMARGSSTDADIENCAVSLGATYKRLDERLKLMQRKPQTKSQVCELAIMVWRGVLDGYDAEIKYGADFTGKVIGSKPEGRVVN